MSEILNNIIFTNVNQSNKVFNQHFHNSYFLGITHTGIYKSLSNNNTYSFYAKSTRINNPLELHSGNSSSWDCHSLYPTVELMSDLYSQIYYEKKIPIFKTHIIDDKFLYEKLVKVFQAYGFKDDLLLIESNVIEALAYLIKNHCQEAKQIDEYFDSNKIVKNSLEFINDSLDMPLSLDNLASNLNISKYHFLRVFKKQTGLTPHQYIINQRVEKAISLITKGHTILDAALQVGFNDQSHFNRNFKRFYDHSPTIMANKRNFILY